MIVCFVDINGIVDHHCLNFLLMIILLSVCLIDQILPHINNST
jgi:hypothetical protein